MELAYQHALLNAAYWKSLSDEQLVETSFTADDPTLLENLIREVPSTDETPIVEFAYNTKFGSGRLVYCIHCRREMHYRGFVLRFLNGQRMLVGKDCGKKIYGADFEMIEKDFSDARQRAQYLHLKASTLENAATFRAALRSLKSHPATSLFRTLKRTWNQTMPELARALAEACAKGGGALHTTEKVRDFDAEARREERQHENAKLVGAMTKTAVRRARESGDLPSNRKRQKPLYKDVPKFLGTLGGQKFFRIDQKLPDDRIDELAARAEDILDALPKSMYSTVQLRVVFRDLRQMVEALIDEVSRLHEVFDAFEARNLERIARWANDRAIGGNSYSAAIGEIVSRDHFDGEPVAVSFPAEYRPPSVKSLEQFLGVLSK